MAPSLGLFLWGAACRMLIQFQTSIHQKGAL